MPRLFTAVFLFLALHVSAQQPTEPAETTLAGIELGRTTIADIEKMYGKANVVQSAGETTLFQWQRLTVTLTVATQFDSKNPSNPSGTVISVAIQGQGDNKEISRTGKGLKLGAKASDIRKVYGVQETQPSTTVTWPNGTTLLIRIDDKSRVDRLELTTSTPSTS